MADVPPCSGASRPAALFGLDPPSARRLTEGVGTLGVPLRSSPSLRRVEHRAIDGRKDERPPSAPEHDGTSTTAETAFAEDALARTVFAS